ncbi:CapA family protein, partial [Crocinitomicaceae bacterium]|nr:CapA family protein [Crocinitomicaceae bacterium]
ITLGDHPMCAGYGAYSRFRKETPVFPFEKVKHLFLSSDLSFGNLECSHSEINLRKNDLGSIQMRGDPRHIQGLVEAGIDIVNVANNHSMQHGKEVFLDSLKNLESHGVHYCGASKTSHLVAESTVIKKNGLSIGFLGYSLRPRQYFEYEPLYTEGHEEGIINDIKKLRPEIDVIVVSLHWGDEFIQRPSPEEIRIARSIIDAGANLIIGHHPHVLRGVEKYQHGYIAYSLGNFICDMVWDDPLRSSLIFQCDFTKNGIQNVELVPAFINDNFQPELLDGEKASHLLSEIEAYSKQLSEESLSSFEALSSAYVRDADEAQQANRRKCHIFFLSRVWKFPFVIMVQQFATFFRNRVHEFVHGS